ncbi:MAG: hypothetical protein IPP15_09000 [Saprospiraceae bacterium]|uniref:Uncharacterized protein n=1 Tax=Candidatus Opimibacter skivensis TaxID=2982028 RepID=A0A9D7SX93_9BACT|nr:hypothetical protein [Candidatus Opimibacter skivensis]
MMEIEEDASDPLKALIPEFDSILDEEALLDLFTTRVEELIRDNLDLLLSSLYRLDVEEYKIQRALRSSTVPAARGIAQLIIDRQKEKIKTRKMYSSGKEDMWKGLE